MPDELLLRKLQRQKRGEEFARAAADLPGLRLPAARLRGAAAVQACASDPAVPSGDRELAAWAGGDLRAGLMALRRRSGCAAIAEGWLLLLKGEAARALERFAAAAAEQPRRAAAGQAVALAQLGRGDEAAALWAGIGPVPGAVFPAAGTLTRQLTRVEAGWDGSALRRLLVAGGLREVERALHACPPERRRERAWLALRLADLHWQTEPLDVRIEALLDVAAREAELLPDVLKRRFWRALERLQRDPAAPAASELAVLHQQLAQRDPAAARACVEAVLAELHPTQLMHLQNPWIDTQTGTPKADAPVEWVLLWMRQAAPMIAEARGPFAYFAHLLSGEAGVALPPDKMAEWRPWLRRLDAAYGADAGYIAAKLGLLRHFRQHAEQRLAAFQMLLAQPERCDEFLPRWIDGAMHDRRPKKAISAELPQLLQAFPGRMSLSAFAISFSGNPAEIGRLAAMMPPIRSAVFRWLCGEGPLPSAGAFGQDDEADLFLVRKGVAEASTVEFIAQLLLRLPGRMHQVGGMLLRLGQLQQLSRLGILWAERLPADWRGWYHAGKALAAEGRQREAGGRFSQALGLLPPGQAEVAELERWFELHPEGRLPHLSLGQASPARPPPPQPPAVGIRAAAAACGMSGALALAGLAEMAAAIDAGMPLEDFPTEQRRHLAQMLDAMRSQLRTPHREEMQALRGRLP